MVDIGGYRTGWPAIVGAIVGIGVGVVTDCIPCGAAAGGAVSGGMEARENGTDEFQGAFVGAFIAGVSAEIGYEAYEGSLFGTQGVLHAAIAGAISGAVAGGMSAVIYGGDAKAVIVGAAVGAGVAAAMYEASPFFRKIHDFRVNVVWPPSVQSGWQKFWAAVTSNEAREVVAAVTAVAVVAMIVAPPLGVLLAGGTLMEAALVATTGVTIAGIEAPEMFNEDAGMIAEGGVIETETTIGEVEETATAPSRIHGNSASSTATTFLYRLTSRTGEYLKTGISSNPLSRYSRTFMQDKNMQILQEGSRGEMLSLQRFIVERDPGPMNFESWAGRYADDVPGGS